MKTLQKIACVLIVALSWPSSPALAKPKHKPPAPAETEPDVSGVPEPARSLAPYMIKLDQLLALQRPGPPAWFEEAPGRLLIVRQELAAKLAASPPAEQTSFNAAIAACDALTAALNDRQKALGNFQASAAVTGTGALNQGPRKDNLGQGLHGGEFARAVGEVVELDRERDRAKQARQQTAAGNHALSAMAVNAWNTRAAQWRQVITAKYAAIQVRPEPAAAAPAPAAPAAPVPVPAPAPAPPAPAPANATAAAPAPPAVAEQSPAPSAPNAAAPALEERLRDSRWKVMGGKGNKGNMSFTLHSDGTTTATWHKGKGGWQVTGPHTAVASVFAKGGLSTLTFDEEITAASFEAGSEHSATREK
jgi:hypothetical protein